MSHKLLVSTPLQEGSLQASKWMYQRMLLDENEIKDLFRSLGSIYLFHLSKICGKEDISLDVEDFFAVYKKYLLSVKNECSKDFDKKEFSLALSKTLDPVYLMEVKPGAFLLKIKEPIIRLQLFQFHYLEEIEDFVMTDHLERGVSWGIEFSFPQFYQDPKTYAAHQHFKDSSYPNTGLFKQIQKWAREKSEPTHFKVDDGVEKRVPFRIGKESLSWVNQHKQLQRQNLLVLNPN